MLQSLRSRLFTEDRIGADASATSLDSNVLIEAIVCETQTAALQVAAIASSLNALAAGIHLRSAGELANFLPGASAVVLELLRSHEEAGLDAGTLLAVKRFFTDIGDTRPDVERLLADLQREGSDHILPQATAAAAKWARLCESAQAAVAALDANLSAALPAYYAKNHAMLLGVLGKAASGETPCIDANGSVVLPDMPQRRKATRRSLLQQCTLRCKGKPFTVIARDISATGIGLERTPELKAGELVQIELTGGRRVMGVVVWASSTGAGIRLAKALPPGDPLLVG